ncbi:hypothetical protein VQ056_11675 [Paenibacillus sp. JTLBN-2024]
MKFFLTSTFAPNPESKFYRRDFPEKVIKKGELDDYSKKLGGYPAGFADVFYEYPRFRPENKKEKAAFTVLASAGWALAIALMWFPRLPGPTEFINYVTKPIWSIFYPEG